MFGLPWWLSDKNFALNAGDLGAIPGSGRFPGGGYGNPLWYSCLENPMNMLGSRGEDPERASKCKVLTILGHVIDTPAERKH